MEITMTARLAEPDFMGKCTVIESLFGEAKLIKRADGFRANLEILKFPSLEDCLNYADRNRFQVNVIHSGKRKNQV